LGAFRGTGIWTKTVGFDKCRDHYLVLVTVYRKDLGKYLGFLRSNLLFFYFKSEINSDVKSLSQLDQDLFIESVAKLLNAILAGSETLPTKLVNL